MVVCIFMVGIPELTPLFEFYKTPFCITYWFLLKIKKRDVYNQFLKLTIHYFNFPHYKKCYFRCNCPLQRSFCFVTAATNLFNYKIWNLRISKTTNGERQ